MNQILEQLGTYGIVPVVVLQDAAKAEPLAEALCKGGLACAEVTFRTDAAEERKIPGDAGGSRNCAHNRAGGPRRKSRSKIYRQPGPQPGGSKMVPGTRSTSDPGHRDPD